MTDSLPSYAATLAPEVDRVFIAGHSAARPLVRVMAQQRALSGFGILVDLRIPLLAVEGMTDGQARAIQRYIDPEDTRAGIDDAVARGFIERRCDRWLPTEMGRLVLDGLSAALVDGTAGLWGEQSAACEAVAAVASRVVDAAECSAEPLPAFRTVLGGRPPLGTSPPYTCWWLVATLRYLRADDHAFAWAKAGLDAVEVSVLTHLCHSDSPQTVIDIGGRVPWHRAVPGVLGRMRSEDLVEEAKGGWRITEAGRRVRSAIEAVTSVRNGAWYRVLAANELSGLLESLRALHDN
jgi:hypothetical protein